jgi:predicted metalloprotease
VLGRSASRSQSNKHQKSSAAEKVGVELGDVKEATNAATAIGDDRLQRQAQGYVVPESFTHRTSEQRVRWFYKGLQSGDMMAGNTFAAGEL